MTTIGRRSVERAACVCAAALTFLACGPSSAGLVISQIYGGGGNTGAAYTNDYVEVFNDSPTAMNLSGLSIQYASATGSGNFGFNSTALTPLPNFLLQPGQYFLIEESANLVPGDGAPLPPPDLIDPTPIAMSATAGKVALVNSVASLGCNGGSTPCSAAQLALIIDLVGYGTGALTGANFFEGSGAAPTLTNSTADFRKFGGLQDLNDNAADFVRGTPDPRNTVSPLVAIPEPATLALAAVALAGLGCSRRRGSRCTPRVR